MGNVTRRAFLKGSTICLTALGGLRLGLDPRRAKAGWIGNNFIVYLFLRGGCDGLSLVAPLSGPDRDPYVQKRPTLYMRTTGDTAGLPLSGDYGLNYAATGLHDLYQQGKLAIVHGIGFPIDQISRSHFDAQDYCDLGTPGSTRTSTGWLARHLESTGQVPPGAQIPALASGSAPPLSYLGRRDVMTLDDPSSFHPNANSGTTVDGEPLYKLSTMITINQMYEGSGALELAGAGAANTVALVDSLDLANYTPSPGALYPTTGSGVTLGNQAKLIANVAKHDVGLQVATLDYGGRDTHETQGAGDQGINNNQYAARVDGLSQVLTALYNDLAGSGIADRMVVCVQSEFGRRVRENDNHGTDHGSGNPMLVLGGSVRGGQLYGTFGGLQDGELFQNEDVATTTDTRRVLSEVVTSHLGNSDLASVFPGYSYPGPLGILPGDQIFASGFE